MFDIVSIVYVVLLAGMGVYLKRAIIANNQETMGSVFDLVKSGVAAGIAEATVKSVVEKQKKAPAPKKEKAPAKVKKVVKTAVAPAVKGLSKKKTASQRSKTVKKGKN